VPAPARLAALRASTPRITASILNAIHRAIVSAARALRDRTALARRAASLAVSQAARWATSLAPSRAASRAARRAASWTTSLASSRAASWATSVTASLAARLAASRAARRATSLATTLAAGGAASRAANGAVGSAASAGASAIRSSAARASYALPPRARIPAAAAAILALAAAVTAAAMAIGPAAAAGPIGPAIAAAALRPTTPATPGQAPASHSATAGVAGATAPRHHRATAHIAAQAVPAHHSGTAGGRAHRRHHPHHSWRVVLDNWHAITEAAAGHPRGGPLAPAQRLLPGSLTGGQAALPLTPARAANAAVITAQALRLHMGIRSAVIAVATAMQESTLENLGYGDRDSLGLFQQRPSMGWGSPAQVTDPVYASDAFLHALHAYQAAHPGWATQPLWEAAQGVQNSGFPYAYAQWEDQAAHIVAAVTRHLL
jgi:hypothetical protein